MVSLAAITPARRTPIVSAKDAAVVRRMDAVVAHQRAVKHPKPMHMDCVVGRGM